MSSGAAAPGDESPSMKASRPGDEWDSDKFASTPEAADLYARAHVLCTAEPPEFAAALDILKSAVAKGSPRAAYALASWYLPPGRVVKPDFREAKRLLLIAAGADIPEAHYDLAVMYGQGEGMPPDERAAFEWYLRAAIRGDADAAYRIGVAYQYGDEVMADEAVAQIWLDRAEELGVDPETGEPRASGTNST